MSLPSSFLSCRASVTVLEFGIKTSWDSFTPGPLLSPPPPHRMRRVVVLELGSPSRGRRLPFPHSQAGGAQPSTGITWGPP